MTNANIKNGTNGHSTNGRTPSTKGNGHHKDIPIPGEQNPALDAGPAILWDILPPAVIEKLGQTLDPGLVSQRKGRAGGTYSYIEGRTAIDQANRIFGHGGWGYDLVGEVSLRDIENVDGKSGDVKRLRAYSATVRVNVTGALPRTDVGFHAVTDETADGTRHSLQGGGDRRPQEGAAELRWPVRKLPLWRRRDRHHRRPSSLPAPDPSGPGGHPRVRRGAGAGCGKEQDREGVGRPACLRAVRPRAGRGQEDSAGRGHGEAKQTE